MLRYQKSLHLPTVAVNIVYIVVDMSDMESSFAVQNKNIMPVHTNDIVTTISGTDHQIHGYQDALSEGADSPGTSLTPKAAGGASPADPPVSRLSAVLAQQQGEEHHNRLKALGSQDTFVPDHQSASHRGATLMLQIALDILRKSGNLRPYDWIIFLPLLMDATLVLIILERLILLRSNNQTIPYHLRFFQVVSTRMWPWRRPRSLLVTLVTDLCP